MTVARFSQTAVLAALLTLTAGLLPAEGFPLTVTDDKGRALTLPRAPQHIVSLTLPTDEILLSLVDRKRILMVTAFSADPRVSSVAPLVSGLRQARELNVEEIISLSPDLVLVAN